MLTIRSSERLDDLARDLGQTLATLRADPMQSELIVAPTAGMHRWLSLELSRHLGTAAPDRTDGIAANIEMSFPGTLMRRVLYPNGDDELHPWDLELTTWPLLDIIANDAAGASDERYGPLRTPVPGLPPWARARRLADLFDRYLTHRPQMILAWSRGLDIDGGGHSIAPEHAWQPFVWRQLRERIGMPSTAELLPDRLEQLRSGEHSPQLPARLYLFGLTNVPGGEPFLQLLGALGEHRDVLLLTQHPSTELADAVRDEVGASGSSVHRRADDPTVNTAVHPLLARWGRPAREANAILAGAFESATKDQHAAPAVAGETEPETLLRRLQADIRSNKAPRGDHALDPADASIRIHSCHGLTRQVEVLKDQLLHLLENDETLEEDDIFVLCPSLEDVVPALEAVLGPPAPPTPDSHTDRHATDLRYRVTDRSIRSNYSGLAALGMLVELVASRFSGAAVLEFAALQPVRTRFGFDDDAIATIARWIDDTSTSWGLDGTHRARWGLPVDHDAGSWNESITRLLLGVAMTDDQVALAPGDTRPVPVEGSNVGVLGGCATLLSELEALVTFASNDHSIGEWCERLSAATTSLCAFPAEAAWQEQQLTGIIADVAAAADAASSGGDASLSLDEIRYLLGRQLQSPAGRSDFFRGGITVSSMTPLRGIPTRVICLLGLDDSAFSAAPINGDDLIAAEPLVGDRDRRSDTRQALLDATLSATDHLIILRSGNHEITNQPIPPAVAVAEFADAVHATVDSPQSENDAWLTLVHPRQRFDPENFSPATPLAIAGGAPVWSFDAAALNGARARTNPRPSEPLMDAPLAATVPDTIALSDLHAFIAHPARYFLQQRLEVAMPHRTEPDGAVDGGAATAHGLPGVPDGRNLHLELDALQNWNLKDRLLTHLLASDDLDSFIRREQASGTLPPGQLGDAALHLAIQATEPFAAALRSLGAHPPERQPRPVPVDLMLDDGTRIVGIVPDDGAHDRPGPLDVTVSRPKDTMHLRAWLNVSALTAAHPDEIWSSTAVTATSSKKTPVGVQSYAYSAEDPAERAAEARRSLAIAVDLFRRGQQEPLPIFPLMSRTIHEGGNTSSAWRPQHGGRGDGDDQWINLAFNHPSRDDVLSAPVEPHDPTGTGNRRAARYASILWGQVLHSTPAATVDVS